MDTKLDNRPQAKSPLAQKRRHVAARLWIEQGLQPKEVQHLLGHASLAMTMDLYGHLGTDEAADEALAQASERLIPKVQWCLTVAATRTGHSWPRPSSYSPRMTMRTSTLLVCKCGHAGKLDCSENDSPFSRLWECYSLDGFTGRDLTITDYSDIPPDILTYMTPTCPKCGAEGKVAFARRARPARDL
jgi:hypothetical protein